MSSSTLSFSIRFLLGFACAAIVVTFIHLNAGIVNSFLLALLFVMTVSPLLHGLMRAGLPAFLAYLITLVAAVCALALVALLLPATAMRLRHPLADYAAELGITPGMFADWLAQRGFSLPGLPLIGSLQGEEWVVVTTQLINNELALQALTGFFDSVSLVMLTVLLIVFFLLEAVRFPQKVRWQLVQGNPEFDHLYVFSNQIQKFVSINAIWGFIGGLLTTVVLYMLGIDFAPLWGFAYFILGFVPGVGMWLALIPPLALALITANPLVAVLVFLWYVGSNVIIGNVIKPAFLSGDLNLSPLWSVIAMVLWSAILGLPGLILGVPLTIAIRELILERDEGTHWLSQMMGAQIPDALDDPQE